MVNQDCLLSETAACIFLSAIITPPAIFIRLGIQLSKCYFFFSLSLVFLDFAFSSLHFPASWSKTNMLLLFFESSRNMKMDFCADYLLQFSFHCNFCSQVLQAIKQSGCSGNCFTARSPLIFHHLFAVILNNDLHVQNRLCQTADYWNCSADLYFSVRRFWTYTDKFHS